MNEINKLYAECEAIRTARKLNAKYAIRAAAAAIMQGDIATATKLMAEAKQFRLVQTYGTYGTGTMGAYQGRNTLDTATLDKFFLFDEFSPATHMTVQQGSK